MIVVSNNSIFQVLLLSLYLPDPSSGKGVLLLKNKIDLHEPYLTCMIIIVFGLPGSGKSYFASRLAKKLGALYINTDEVRMKMFSQRSYSDAEKLAVYDKMIEILQSSYPENKVIILDGTFYKSAIRKKFEVVAEKLNSKFIFIEVTANENKIKDRLEKPRTTSEADYGVYLKLREVAEPLEEEHLVLDSSLDDVDEMLTKSIQFLESGK